MTIDWKVKSITGFIVILIGLGLLGISNQAAEIASTLISFGAVLVLVSLIVSRRREAIPQDERTRAVGAKAASYSWMFTLIALSVLVWVDQLKIAVLNSQQTLGVLLIVMIVSMLGSRWWFERHVEQL